MSRRPIGIDLFAGVGGLSLGFEQAGFDIVAASDIDPIHCAAHAYNFPNCKTICRDIGKLTGKEIRHLAGIGRTDVDVVFGGAPCQGFSMIGKRVFDDPRNVLVHHFVRLVSELNPKYFVFENVKGLTIGKHKQYLDKVIAAFERCGYRVARQYRVLNAAEYGVPQSRARLFLMGARKGLELPNYPSPTVCPRVKRINGFDESLPLGPSVWDAISDLPDVGRYKALWANDSVIAHYGRPTHYSSILRLKAKDAKDFGYSRALNPRLLTASLRTEHTPLSQSRFAKTRPGEAEPVSRFLKLDPNGICNTLRAGTGSDRGAFTSPRPIHPYRPRCITNREAARLHSYPDWFRFHKTKWHGFRQIGNSVPPLLGRAVAAEVIRALGVKPKKPIKVLACGDERLLELDMSAAAAHFGVSASVMGKRLKAVGRRSPSRSRGKHGMRIYA